jgi:Cu2+-exporting ATPase
MLHNFARATGYNVFAIPLAASVFYNPGILLSPAIGAIPISANTVIMAINAKCLKL